MKHLLHLLSALLLTLPLFSAAQELSAEDFYASAERLFAQNSYNGAIGHLDLAIDHDKNSKYFKLRGDAYLKTQKFGQALADYNFALRKGEEDHEIYLNRAICKINTEEFDEAILDIYKFLETEAESARAFYYLAVVDYFTFNHKGAIDYIENATGIDADYMEAYYLLGAVYGEMGKMDKALEAYEIAYEINPEYHRVMLNVGVLKLENNDAEGGLDILENLIDESHDFGAELYYYIAEAKLALHDKDGACEAWNEGGAFGDADCAMNYKVMCLGSKGEKSEKKQRLTKVTF